MFQYFSGAFIGDFENFIVENQHFVWKSTLVCTDFRVVSFRGSSYEGSKTKIDLLKFFCRHWQIDQQKLKKMGKTKNQQIIFIDFWSPAFGRFFRFSAFRRINALVALKMLKFFFGDDFMQRKRIISFCKTDEFFFEGKNCPGR